jgi:hypothetical protein
MGARRIHAGERDSLCPLAPIGASKARASDGGVEIADARDGESPESPRGHADGRQTRDVGLQRGHPYDR